MIPLVAAYCYAGIVLQRYHMRLLRQASRLNAATLNPVIQRFSEMMLGGKIVRSLGLEHEIYRQFSELVDENQKNQLVMIGVRQWFSERIQYVSLIVIVPSIVLAVKTFN